MRYLSWNYCIEKRCINSTLCFSSLYFKINLKTTQATQESDIQTNCTKSNSGFFADFAFTNLNNFIARSIFPLSLKLANITPVHKNLVSIKRSLTASKFFIRYFENI